MVLGTRLRKKFIKAVTEGNEAVVETALSTRDPTTLLALLQTDIQPGHCAVCYAAAQGHKSVVKHLLAAGDTLPTNPDTKSYVRSLNTQAKYYAAAWDSELRELVLHHTEACVDIMGVAEASPGGTCPPLYAAARKGDVAQLQQLLADGETDSIISSPGPPWMPFYAWSRVPKSALEAAAAAQDQNGHGSAAAVQLLVSAASPEQLTGRCGFAALLAAIKRSSESHTEVAQVLLSAGVPLAFEGEAALVHAASCGFDTFKAVVAAVQQRGGSLDDVDTAIGTALQRVVRWGKTDFVELLLQQGANVNAVGIEGVTPLLQAVRMSNTHMVQMLLAAGADAAAAAPGAVSPLAMAARCLSVPLVDMLLERSTAALPASALIKAAWEAAGEAFQDDDDSEWEEEEVLQADECRRLQDSIVSRLLKAAAVRDPVATAAALADCSQQVAELYKEAKQNFDSAAGCSCGCCPQPDPVDPALIQRSSVMLKALSGLWLGPSLVVADVTAQQAAVQHMLVVTSASLKQQQEQQQILEAVEELDERERQLAARERQLARREQEMAAKEQQQRAGNSKRARPAAAAAAAAAGPATRSKRARPADDGVVVVGAGPATRSKRARTAAGGAGTKR